MEPSIINKGDNFVYIWLFVLLLAMTDIIEIVNANLIKSWPTSVSKWQGIYIVWTLAQYQFFHKKGFKLA